MLLWVNNFYIMGPKKEVMKVKEKLKSMFEMKDIDKMDDYVGCKVERD